VRRGKCVAVGSQRGHAAAPSHTTLYKTVIQHDELLVSWAQAAFATVRVSAYTNDSFIMRNAQKTDKRFSIKLGVPIGLQCTYHIAWLMPKIGCCRRHFSARGHRSLW